MKEENKNKLKNIFSDDLDLPEEFSWEFMKEDIMPEVQLPEKGSNGKKFLLILFLFISGCSTLVLFSDKQKLLNNTSSINSNNTESARSIESKKQEDLSEMKLNEHVNNESVTEKPINQTEKKKEDNITRNTQNKSSFTNKLPKSPLIVSKTTNSSSFKTPSNKINQEIHPFNFNYKINSIFVEENKDEIKLESSQTDSNLKRNLNILLPLKSNEIQDVIGLSIEENYVLDIDKSLFLPPSLDKKTIQLQNNNYLSIFGGINSTKQEFSGQNKVFQDLKNNHESSFIGYQIGVEYERNIFNDIYVGTGLSYNQYTSEVDYSSSKDSSYVKEDALVLINVQPFTLDTFRLYQDTIVNVTTTTRVINYNKYRMAEIPVYVGYQKKFNRLSVGADVGVGFAVFKEARGRVLDTTFKFPFRDQKHEYEYHSDVDINLLLRARFRYELSESMGLQLSIGYKSFLTNWLGEEPIRTIVKPRVTNLSVGLYKGF